jgi:hypothetical protein
MSVPLDLIPEAIFSEKCEINMGEILNGYRVLSIWNAGVDISQAS